MFLVWQLRLSASPSQLLLIYSMPPSDTFLLSGIRRNTKRFFCSENQVGFSYSPIQNWIAYGIVNMKYCFHKERKLGLNFLGAKREVNYCIELQNRRHKKKLTVGCVFLMNSASEPQKTTCSEKHFPIEPDFRDLPV